MEVILEVRYGKYFMERTTFPENKFSTNNVVAIKEEILTTMGNALKVTDIGDNRRVDFADKSITLVDWKKYQNLDLYKHVLGLIKENDKKQDKKDDFFDDEELLAEIEKVGKKNKTKITNVNIKLIKKIAATGALLLGLGAAVSVASQNTIDFDAQYTITQEDNSVKEPEVVISSLSEESEAAVLSASQNLAEIQEDVVVTPTAKTNYNTVYKKQILEDTHSIFENAKDIIPVGTQLNTWLQNKYDAFYTTKAWDYIQRYCDDYGVDPYIVLAMSARESGLRHEDHLPNGKDFNGHAYGFGQIEHPENEHEVKAYNFNTGNWDTIEVNVKNAVDLKQNIRIMVAKYQAKINEFDFNQYLTLQSYNYGNHAIHQIIEKYASECGVSQQSIIDDYGHRGWQKYVDDYHINPKDYNPNWQYKTYGDPNYIENVLANFDTRQTTTVTYKSIETGKTITIDLETMEVKTKAYSR